MNTEYKDFSRVVYDEVYAKVVLDQRKTQAQKGSQGGLHAGEIERMAQKEAIKAAILRTMRKFQAVEPSRIWKSIYEIHVHHKSGIDDSDTIAKVISADQSWKKSSGHAFEELIKLLANAGLQESGIEILLQRDLSTILKAGELANEPRDISWLKEQVKGSVFDLFATYVDENGRRFCFGCIQSKTSIRDRVTRDREPSLAAMNSFFWSVAIVLDGDFLKLPKFKAMVNGGSAEYSDNGWHGMYVFSDLYSDGRIYPLHVDFGGFVAHAKQAASYWKRQRQWFDKKWKAE